jgi:uncharacterized protein (TIGR02266 family)
MTIAKLSVRYPVATVEDFIEGHAPDVSARGLCIKGDRAIAIGTLVEFDVQISGNQSVLSGAGRVAWVRRASASAPDRPQAIGVRFVELDEASQEVLRRLLDRTPDAGQRYEEEFDASTRVASPPGQGGRPGSYRPLPPVVAPPRRTTDQGGAPLPPVSAPPRRSSSLPPPTPRPPVPGASAPPALPAVTAPPRKAAAAPPLATAPDASEQDEVDRLLAEPTFARPAALPRTMPPIPATAAEPDAIPVDVDLGDLDGDREATVIVQRDTPVPQEPLGSRRSTHVVLSEAPPPTWYEHRQGDSPDDAQRTKSRMHPSRLALGAALAILSVGLLALGLGGRASRTSASDGLSAPVSSASAWVVAPSPAQAPAPVVDEATPVEQGAVPTIALSSLPQAPVAHATDAGAVSSIPQARRAKTNCNPTFTLDAEGNKHFKPECFLH